MINTWTAIKNELVELHTTQVDGATVINQVIVNGVPYQGVYKDYGNVGRLEFDDRKGITLPDEVELALFPKKVTVPVIPMKEVRTSFKYASPTRSIGWCNRCHSNCYGDCRS